MNSPTGCFLALFLYAIASAPVRAQFYAPDTEYHDRVQRLFVVETARVLGWRENLRTPELSEITYMVSVDEKRMTSWDLHCLDAEGKTVRSIKVSYPEKLLSEGPQFYREVFRQIWTNGNWNGVASLTAEELSQRYWEGAEKAGMSREEGLRELFKLAGGVPSRPETEYAPALAGLLGHTPLPGLRGGLTLDVMMLSRAAAWLCLSESMIKNGAAASNENWAPILFQAGREVSACELWTGKVKAEEELKPTFHQWWDFFLRRPKAKDAFLFAVDARQRPYAMPMLAYYCRLDVLGRVMEELFAPLYYNKQNTHLRLYDYGPFLSYCGVGAGRIMEGAWPALFRQEWLKVLNAFPTSKLDYQGYAGKLAKTPDLRSVKASAVGDASLIGLKELAPLLQEGYDQGVGKLIPVGTVTARDLLNYGWEMNAFQMGSRYDFVNQNWGIHDLADTIFKEATRDIQGQAVFFRNNFQKSVYNLPAALQRLQLVDDLVWRTMLDVQPFSQNLADTNSARLYYKRCWLRPYEIRWQAWTLFRADLAEEMMTLADTYHKECGPMADVLMLEYLASFKEQDLTEVKGLKELRERLGDSMAEPTALKINALYESRYANKSNIVKAQEFEKLFWENPDSGLERRVFSNYLMAGAYKSAKRFYHQIREVVERDVGFSNIIGPEAWMLGYLTGDEELMKTALQDSDTGSKIAMITAIWNYAAHDDSKGMEKQIDELIERYESREGTQSMGRRLKEFMPLMSAFKNPKHGDHEKALDFFGKDETGAVLRWILIQKYKLPVEEAIRFLGGKETDYLRRVMILYLLKDTANMRDALSAYSKSGGSGAYLSLATYLEVDLLKIPIGAEEKDLKPAGATSIRPAVIRKLGIKANNL